MKEGHAHMEGGGGGGGGTFNQLLRPRTKLLPSERPACHWGQVSRFVRREASLWSPSPSLSLTASFATVLLGRNNYKGALGVNKLASVQLLCVQ